MYMNYLVSLLLCLKHEQEVKKLRGIKLDLWKYVAWDNLIDNFIHSRMMSESSKNSFFTDIISIRVYKTI